MQTTRTTQCMAEVREEREREYNRNVWFYSIHTQPKHKKRIKKIATQKIYAGKRNPPQPNQQPNPIYASDEKGVCSSFQKPAV